MNIDPGELNQRIELHSFAQTPDGMGGYTRTSRKLVTLWGKVKPMRGGEQEQAAKTQMVMAYLFVVRANPSVLINETMFFRWKGRDFNIRYVPPALDREQYLFIEAETGVAQ